MTDQFNRAPFDFNVFIEDLRQTALMLSVPFDGEVVRQAVTAFRDDLARCVVQLKTTSDIRDGLYFRFFCARADNLVDRADAHGLRRFRPSRLDLFQAQLMDTYPDATPAGLDFHCTAGLTKLWFHMGRRPINELTKFWFMPESARHHQAFFEDHGLKECFFLALDYRNSTINIYTFLEPAYRTSGWLEKMLADTWPTTDATVALESVARALHTGACIGMTFSWDNPALHRWAIYGLNVRYQNAAARRALPPLPPHIRAFVEAAPTLSCDPHLNVAWSFEATRCVVKSEKSYANALPAASATADPLFIELAGHGV